MFSTVHDRFRSQVTVDEWEDLVAVLRKKRMDQDAPWGPEVLE